MTQATLEKSSTSAAPPTLWGKVAYGAIFTLIVPALLAVWAWLLPVNLPAVRWPVAGLSLAASGLLLVLGGMWALWHWGKGLPMNAYPPASFVRRGVYALVPHPIYTGFSLACLGVSVATGSAAGLWVIWPIATLGCVALVLGYEGPDIRRRFGTAAVTHRPIIHLPSATDAPANWMAVISVYVLAYVPWLFGYEATAALPLPPVTWSTYLPGEQNWPVYQNAELFYGSVYPLAILIPWFARRERDLRALIISGTAGTLIGLLCFLALPLTVVPRPFTPSNWLGELLAFERAADPSFVNALPSFHVMWALLIARLAATRGKIWTLVAYAWAIGVALSCIATGMHSVADVLAGGLLFVLVAHIGGAYRAVLRISERLANAFTSYRFGPVRVINHAVWSGLAAAVGVALASALAGGEWISIGLIWLCSVAGAGLWAQLIEGSPRLLRPFGYYGAIVGGLLGVLAAWATGCSPWLAMGAAAAAAPLIQAVGRVRCLVQGCCHGRAIEPAHLGIVVINPSSRVCGLGHLTGVPIHPTQLYSILGNLVIAVILLRAWAGGAGPLVITGFYLIFAGVARFVEEAYRGEPQTRHILRLPEYQWYAIVSLLIGIGLTLLPDTIATPAFIIRWPVLVAAGVAGLVTACAMSVDFPLSQRRFARLTG